MKHIIVCGHYGCGGIKYGSEAVNAGFLNCWVTHIRDVYTHNKQELDIIPDA